MERKKRTLKQILNDSKLCICWLEHYIKLEDKPYIKLILKDIDNVLVNCDIETLEQKY